MQKFLEVVGLFALISLMVMLSINYAFSGAFLREVFGAPHVTYVQSLILYGLSNLLFKQLTRKG